MHSRLLLPPVAAIPIQYEAKAKTIIVAGHVVFHNRKDSEGNVTGGLKITEAERVYTAFTDVSTSLSPLYIAGVATETMQATEFDGATHNRFVTMVSGIVSVWNEPDSTGGSKFHMGELVYIDTTSQIPVPRVRDASYRCFALTRTETRLLLGTVVGLIPGTPELRVLLSPHSGSSSE